jgi:hypothetical protein
VGLDCLYSMVTITTKLFSVGNNVNHGNQGGLDCLCNMATKLFSLGNHVDYGNQIFCFRAKKT